MAGLVGGDVVVVPLPFSDLSQAKRRPPIVVAALPGDDVILCQITSQNVHDAFAVAVPDDDFEVGGLRAPSNVRPNRLFTADSRLVLYTVGRMKKSKLDEVIAAVIQILRG